jgi:pimeloyl-ACP methyl ester carboxylesterase
MRRSTQGGVMSLVLLTLLLARTALAQDTLQELTRPINGMQMHYQVRGHGPPLVLLHYYHGCGEVWQPHLVTLAEHYRLIIPDLRGHGRSTNPAGRFTHRQSALDVFALLDQLGVDHFKAMGLSTGGMTLLHMATQQPSRVEAMVLIGATSYFPEQARAIMRGISPDSVTAHPWDVLRQCAKRGTSQIRQLVTQFHDFKDSYDDMNFTEPYLATITAQTLIVQGDRDEFFPVAIPVEMYRAIPHSFLWIIPNGAHIPVLGDHARDFQDIALAFLRGDWEKH